MDENRRRLLGLGAAFVAGAKLIGVSDAEAAEAVKNVNLITPKNYVPRTDEKSKKALRKATLGLVVDLYGDRPLPIWGGKNAKQADIETRINQTVDLVCLAIDDCKIYPLEPSLIVSQIMTESFFYPFAISSVFALGIAQFMKPTAGDYKMVCVGTRPEHSKLPYKLGEYSDQETMYKQLSKTLNELEDNPLNGRKASYDLVVKLALGTLGSTDIDEAKALLRHKVQVDEIRALVALTRKNFRAYLDVNLEGRSLSNRKDRDFLEGFDQRLIPNRAIPAMIKYMARAFEAVNGNKIVALAAYNAGPGAVKAKGVYTDYGKLPGNGESPGYVNNILVDQLRIIKKGAVN
ncbi:MAG TPA: transglycosylase SLT domain-containing protein [Candidatus Nanoarchaeia archaeon]|nr:transglycosylase SLT domain-containing protein [Candidatus Nanoarchaeia archaeon]